MEQWGIEWQLLDFLIFETVHNYQFATNALVYPIMALLRFCSQNLYLLSRPISRTKTAVLDAGRRTTCVDRSGFVLNSMWFCHALMHPLHQGHESNWKCRSKQTAWTCTVGVLVNQKRAPCSFNVFNSDIQVFSTRHANYVIECKNRYALSRWNVRPLNGNNSQYAFCDTRH